MADKVIAFGCWDNEMPIAEKGQCGKLRARLFSTEALAREFYDPVRTSNCDHDDVIVRVTCESLGSVHSANGEPK